MQYEYRSWLQEGEGIHHIFGERSYNNVIVSHTVSSAIGVDVKST